MLHRYREVLAIPAVRTAVLIGFIARIPFFGAGVVVTLHVVRTLERSYTEAGLASAVLVLAIAASGPWRGRLLDRYGLRRVLIPSVVVQIGYALTAPSLEFGPFLLAQAVAGLFFIPVQAILRQAVMAAAPEHQRRAVLSLDGIILELSAGLAPAIAVWAATTWATGSVLAAVFLASAASGVLFYVVDLPLRRAGHPDEPEVRPPTRSWFGGAVLALLVGGVTSTLVFAGTDLSAVATLNEVDRASAIGWVLALWAVGSLVGGLVYGGITRPLDPFLLLAVLGLVTLPPALSSGPVSLGLLLLVAGLLGQPVITGTVERLTDRVPESARGEAMGWHSTAMTTGIALGAPVSGMAIDRWGGQGGFVVVGSVAVVVGVALWWVSAWRTGRVSAA